MKNFSGACIIIKKSDGNCGAHLLLRTVAQWVAAVAVLAFPLSRAAAQGITLEKQVAPIMNEFCVDCHRPEKLKGDFDMMPLLKGQKVTDHRDHWEDIARALENHDMPPDNKPQPTEQQRQMVVSFIDGTLSNADCKLGKDPRRVTIRRLNRTEYRHTVHDLLGVNFNIEDFPNDEVGFGFDNVADALTLSPMLMEKFMDAAEKVAKQAIVARDPKRVERVRLAGAAFKVRSGNNAVLEGGQLGLYQTGEAVAEFDLRDKAKATVRIRALAEQAGNELPKLGIAIDDGTPTVFEIKGDRRSQVLKLNLDLAPGKHAVTLAYLNNYVNNDSPDAKLRGDRNIFVESVEIEWPASAIRETKELEKTWFRVPPKWNGISEGEAIVLLSSGEVWRDHWFPAAGEYRMRIQASADPAGDEFPKMAVRVGGKDVKIIDVRPGKKANDYDVTFQVAQGNARIAFELTNDLYDEKKKQDRNIYLDQIVLEYPLDYLPDSHRRLIPKVPAAAERTAAAKTAIKQLADRAYRRHASELEVNRLVGFAQSVMESGGTYEEGIQAALQAVLCSPHFLFRWELDPGDVKPGQNRELNDYEVASRLSFFLWCSMPDDALFQLAAKGELRKNGNLEKQVDRMLKDWRIQRFVESFAGQWLQTRNLSEINPDSDVFPKWKDNLKYDMQREAEMFFGSVIKEDRALSDLISARYTFLNENLAKHYGLDSVKGGDFRKVELPADSPRGGVLTMGGVLLTTSIPTRTAPVIRGKWILEQILGTPPPPPPPSVPAFPEQSSVNQSASLRVRLEQHRANPDCATCHSKMDPLGFALENFDATGAWRTKDGKFEIDPSGKTPDGKSFRTAGDLKNVLAADPKFIRSFTEKLMVFATGRGLVRSDKCFVDEAVAKTAAGGNRISVLITAIVTSEAFTKRKVDEAVPGQKQASR